MLFAVPLKIVPTVKVSFQLPVHTSAAATPNDARTARDATSRNNTVRPVMTSPFALSVEWAGVSEGTTKPVAGSANHLLSDPGAPSMAGARPVRVCRDRACVSDVGG